MQASTKTNANHSLRSEGTGLLKMCLTEPTLLEMSGKSTHQESIRSPTNRLALITRFFNMSSGRGSPPSTFTVVFAYLRKRRTIRAGHFPNRQRQIKLLISDAQKHTSPKGCGRD
jgi:hypothetical protein